MRKSLFALFAASGCAVIAGVAMSTANANATPVPSPGVAPESVAVRPLAWAQPMPDKNVQNLHRITPFLYRSAQISSSDLPQLRALGIRKILSFRAFHSDERLLEGSGITLQSVPINTWNIRDDDMVVALRALRDVDREGPILIHCQHGADRTGLVSALYRMVYQNWTKQQAEDELLHGGYGFHPIWANIKSYLEHVDVEWLRRQVAIAPTQG